MSTSFPASVRHSDVDSVSGNRHIRLMNIHNTAKRQGFVTMRGSMNRTLYPAKAVSLGLFTTQLVATVFIYLSNIDLYHKLQAVQSAGYLAVPNEHIWPSLQGAASAFYGALFFTFTAGAGLSALTLALTWIWDRLLARHKAALVLLLIIWGAGLFLVNLNGLDPMGAGFVLLVPPVVFWAARRWMPTKEDERGGVWRRNLAFLLPLAVIAIVWFPQNDRFLFIDIRDNILLSSQTGRALNDFYYRYTLYPAQAFKSLTQKTIKTCRLPELETYWMSRALEKAVLKYDYLPLVGDRIVDLDIALDGDNLLLKQNQDLIVIAKFDTFLSDPARFLNEFSRRTDIHSPLRRLTYFSLLTGMPLTIYILFFTLFDYLAALFLKPGQASLIAAMACLALGLSLLLPLYLGRNTAHDGRTVEELLASPAWQSRVASLRLIERRALEIASFPDYRKLTASDNVQERYWLAGALSVSRNSDTYADILVLLEDPQPNVVCAALRALGLRQNTEAIPVILERINSSRHWYVQWYAYRALKDLGWRQKKSE